MSKIHYFRLVTAVVLSLLCVFSLRAEPWLSAGDMLVRHDLQVLADAGVIRAPITTWPISIASIANELDDFDQLNTLSSRQQLAYSRLQRKIQHEKSIGHFQRIVHGAASRQKPLIRGFEDVARSDLEIGSQATLMTNSLAFKLAPTLVDNADDGKNLTFDGSYISGILGNTILSAGYIDRWWGPGWQGSLIYSNNARPIPGISVQRNFVTPFKHRWLSWIGPWNYSITAGRLEGGRDVPDPYHLGMRFAFKPRANLEIGVSRTAQWGGDGRPTDSDSLFNLLLGQDNRGSDGITADNEPGNQLAGFDVRWNQKMLPVDLSLYAQAIGEDEAGGFPSRYMGLVGFEHSRRLANGDLRLWLEYADTTCDFVKSQPRFNCGYENGIYTSGYRYYGRSIGHSIDGDGRNLTLGGVYTLPSGNYLSLQAQQLKLNRGPVSSREHGITQIPTNGHQVELSYNTQQRWGEMRLHVGHQAFDNSLADQDGILVGFEFKRIF